MTEHTYHKEIYNQLTQFAAAFDDCFVWRYSTGGSKKEKIKVRYIFGPKQRVMLDIVNRAKNITLPAIAIEQSNIRRDPTRMQFKDQRLTRPMKNSRDIVRVPMPIPIIMDLSISLAANYKEDIDQIVSNIFPYCNPYFIISWPIPEEFGMDFVDEIRSEVSWSGSVDFTNPINIGNTDKYVIEGTTSFTLKGWIFPALETPQAPIYVIDSHFVAVPTETDLYGYFEDFQSNYGDATDNILVSAKPEFTNGFFMSLPIYEDLQLPTWSDSRLTFFGKRFDTDNKWYLSSNSADFNLENELIQTDISDPISAYRMPEAWIETISDNIANITIPLSVVLYNPSQFSVITSNLVAWEKFEYSFTVSEGPAVSLYIRPNLMDTYYDPTETYTYARP